MKVLNAIANRGLPTEFFFYKDYPTLKIVADIFNEKPYNSHGHEYITLHRVSTYSTIKKNSGVHWLGRCLEPAHSVGEVRLLWNELSLCLDIYFDTWSYENNNPNSRSIKDFFHFEGFDTMLSYKKLGTDAKLKESELISQVYFAKHRELELQEIDHDLIQRREAICCRQLKLWEQICTTGLGFMSNVEHFETDYIAPNLKDCLQ